MKSKSMSERSSNGHQVETLSEDPTSSSTRSRQQEQNEQQYQEQEQDDGYPELSETEVENLEGVTFLRPGEGDKEVTNQSNQSSEAATEYEEPGFETSALDAQPLDALYASYSELIPKMEAQANEVIIGTDDRVRVFATTSFPWRAVCSLKITAADNSKWIGTGWLVSPRTVITAGHCVFMHDHGGWIKSVEVIPGLNNASRPFGSCSSSHVRSVNGWTASKNREYDYGAIILPADCRLGDKTGYFGFSVKTDAYLMASVHNHSGYPGDKGGNQQWFMARKPKSLSSRVITYEIDTMGGQSGGPVWLKVGNVRTCVGIHTNGHISGNSATRIVLPVFNRIQAWKNLGL